MSGFNRITQIQQNPNGFQGQAQQLHSPRSSQSRMLMTPQPINHRQSPMNLASRDPRLNRSQGVVESPVQPLQQRQVFQTPENGRRELSQPPPMRKRVSSEIQPRLLVQVGDEGRDVIPLKKRSLEGSYINQNEAPLEDFEEDYYPANQLGLYSGGYDNPQFSPDVETTANNSEPGSVSLLNDVEEKKEKSGKIQYERIKEDSIEMGGFVLPGSEKRIITKSYNWIAGRSDGQYRVVLGNNTLFKAKNAIDSKTGEKDSTRWRVIRFENRYKENYPYTEFPAKYIDTLINSLTKAKEQYDAEQAEELH